MDKKHLILSVLLIVLLFTVSNTKGAMVKLSLEQLVHDSDLIVVGIVERVESKWVEGKIFSFATISVNSNLKGELEKGTDRVVIKFPGGKIGNIGMKVEDGPDYNVGQYLIAFLKTNLNDSNYETVGASQGKLLIKDNSVVGEDQTLREFMKKLHEIIREAS